MKKIFSAIALLAMLSTNAQVTKINLQASGLTCSMCSNSISKALKTLPFVENVTPNIKNSSFNIVIKKGSQVSFDDVKNKVEGAGFSVAKLNATILFSNKQIANDEHIKVSNLNLHFLNVPAQTLNGEKEIQIIDKGFVSAKAFKKNEVFTKMPCYKTGVVGSCCNKNEVYNAGRMYHVTI